MSPDPVVADDEAYAAEAQQRWPAHYAESQRRLGRLSKTEQQALFEQGAAVTARMGEWMAAGRSVDDPEVQAIVAEHYRWVDAFWTPDREAYVGLGRMYVDDARFAANYDAVVPGLAVFMRDAMAVWAQANLAD